MNKELNQKILENILADKINTHLNLTKMKKEREKTKIKAIYELYEESVKTSKNPDLNRYYKIQYEYRIEMGLNVLKEQFQGYK